LITQVKKSDFYTSNKVS